MKWHHKVLGWFGGAADKVKWLYGKIKTGSEATRTIALTAAQTTLSVGDTVAAWEPEDLAVLREAQDLVVDAQKLGVGYVVGSDRLEAVKKGLQVADASLRMADDQFDSRWNSKYRPWIEAFIDRMKARRLAGFEPSDNAASL